jgi:hypothetical protein
MRAISNRIRTLERTLVPPVLEEGESAARHTPGSPAPLGSCRLAL